MRSIGELLYFIFK